MRQLLINKLITDKKVLSLLTLNDFGTWSSASLSGIIFPLFSISQIKGADLTDVGLSSLVFLGVSAALNLPLGKAMDRLKGYVDETYILVASSVLRGIALILLAYSTSLAALYFYQIILGIARSMNYVSWRVLFSKYLDPKHVGEQWSVYDSVIAIGLGIATFIGGYMGDNFPYSYVILVAGLVSIVGGVFPLFIVKDVKEIAEEK